MYRVTFTEKQLRLVNTALEEWFRLRLGQCWDLMDDLCERGYDLTKENPQFDEAFANYLGKRNALKPVMETVLRQALCESTVKTDLDNLAIEMWQTIRHQFWLERPDDRKSTWTVDASPALKTTDEPLISIERIKED